MHVVFMCDIAAPLFAAPAAYHPLNPRHCDIDDAMLVFVVILAGGGGGGGGRPSSEDPIDSEDSAAGDWRKFRAQLVLSEGGGTFSILLDDGFTTKPYHTCDMA